MYELIHFHELSDGCISKRQIKRQWGDRCAYCGEPHSTGNPLTIDHIVPVSRGGHKLDARNRVSCCLECNKGKGNKTLEGWYLHRPFFSAFAYARLLRWQYPDVPGWAIAHVVAQNCAAHRIGL